MNKTPVFHTETVMASAMKKLFEELKSRIDLKTPIVVYLAGGMAVHLYTASRVTTDVDAEFSKRFIVPNNLMVEVELENRKKQVVYLDTNYNSSFALMHEDYLDDSLPVDLGIENIQIKVLSPVDLAVSKLARFADNDKEDIASLVGLGLVSSSALEDRANSAISGYIGAIEMLKLNIRDAVNLAKEIEIESRLSKNNKNSKP